MSNYTKRRQTEATYGRYKVVQVPWADNYNPYYEMHKPKRLRRNYRHWTFEDEKEVMHAGYGRYATRKELKEQAQSAEKFLKMLSAVKTEDTEDDI